MLTHKRNASAAHLVAALLLQGFKKDELNTERFLNLRYDGTDVPVMTLCPEGGDYAQVHPSLEHKSQIAESFTITHWLSFASHHFKGSPA